MQTFLPRFSLFFAWHSLALCRSNHPSGDFQNFSVTLSQIPSILLESPCKGIEQRSQIPEYSARHIRIFCSSLFLVFWFNRPKAVLPLGSHAMACSQLCSKVLFSGLQSALPLGFYCSGLQSVLPPESHAVTCSQSCLWGSNAVVCSQPCLWGSNAVSPAFGSHAEVCSRQMGLYFWQASRCCWHWWSHTEAPSVDLIARVCPNWGTTGCCWWSRKRFRPSISGCNCPDISEDTLERDTCGPPFGYQMY